MDDKSGEADTCEVRWSWRRDESVIYYNCSITPSRNAHCSVYRQSWTHLSAQSLMLYFFVI